VTWLSELGESFANTAFSGPMLAAVAVSLLAGFVSFASPCVLPLVPGYVGYIGGMAGLEPGARSGVSTAKRAGRGKLVLGVGLFVLGFSLVFVMVAAVFSVGVALVRWQDLLIRLLGVVVAVLGLAFMGFIPFLQRERRMHLQPRAGLWGAPVLGFAFGLGWTPCIGPTLSVVLAIGAQQNDIGRAIALSLAYSLGLGLPFLLVALGLRSSTRLLGFLRRHRVTIMRVGGGLLVLIGLAMVTGLWGRLMSTLQGLVLGSSTVI
jgi:cytochrome c-type biogenesis protein